MSRINKVICLLFFANVCFADKFDFSGQISGWGAVGESGQAGIRYIPEVDWTHPFTDERKLDAELSLNLYGFTPYEKTEDSKAEARAKLYRTWARYSGNQYELRLGLQKISFGPGRYLRSLQWLDNVDPRDPLKLTDGVYAFLGKYCFKNNANVWLWGMYGNEELRGWDIFETDKNKPEFGGRFQFPVPRGEVAFSYNNRRLNKSYWDRIMDFAISDGLENQYGIDGSFDIGIGAWFEAVMNEIKIASGDYAREKYLTVGADYTFDIGPGMHVLCEHFIKSPDAELREADKIIKLTALSVDFNIGTLDNVTAIAYYSWENEEVYPYISWQRTYNNWLINLSFFMNPEKEGALFSGTGGLCIVAYNY